MGTVPTIETVHIDAAMTAISVAYKKNEYVSEQVFPTVGVAKKSDKYYIHDREHLRDDVDDLRRPGDEAREVRWSLSPDNYSCEGHSRTGILPDEIRANSDPAVQAEIRTTELPTDKILLRQEINFRSIIQDFTAVFTGVNTEILGAAPAKWYNGVGGAAETRDPVEDASKAKIAMLKNCGYAPNVCLMNREVAEGIKHNDIVVNRFKFTSGAARALGPFIPDDFLTTLFNVKVIITDAMLNTGDFSGTAVLDFLLGKNAWFFYVTPTPGLQVVTFAYTFYWSAVAGGQNGTVVERERKSSRKSDAFHVHKYYDQKVVDRMAGFCYQAVIA